MWVVQFAYMFVTIIHNLAEWYEWTWMYLTPGNSKPLGGVCIHIICQLVHATYQFCVESLSS